MQRTQISLPVLAMCASAICSLGANAKEPPVATTRNHPDFNSYILQAVDIVSHRGNGGYDIMAAFSRPLQYGSECCIQPTRPPKTMCVAAVAEVIIEAINLYLKKNNIDHPPGTVQMSSWSGGKFKDIKPHLFMYSLKSGGSPYSRGTANTLYQFGIGEEIPFRLLLPGDFVNFNRQKPYIGGHAVIFMSFLDQNGRELKNYSNAVSGFKYFSAQKKTNGFGFRHAFFGKICPAQRPGFVTDCGVIGPHTNRRFLNTGYMFDPGQWAGATDYTINDITIMARRHPRRSNQPDPEAQMYPTELSHLFEEE